MEIRTKPALPPHPELPNLHPMPRAVGLGWV